MKKIRMGSEAKQLLKDAASNLPKLPKCHPSGEPIFVRSASQGQYLIDNYDFLTSNGISLPRKFKIDPKETYGVVILDYVNTEDRLKKAMMRGELDQEITKHYSDYEKYQKWQISRELGNNTEVSKENNDYETKEPNSSICVDGDNALAHTSADVQSATN